MANVFNSDVSSLPVNKDLAKERATASFNTTELTHIIDGGPERTKRRKELEAFVFKDPLFRNYDRQYKSKSEIYEQAVHKSVKLCQWKKQYQWSQEDYEVVSKRINDFDEALTLHQAMFIPALERMCTDEQKAKWLPLAVNYRIIGTYAQTELGHGTNLLKLEMTATFDKNTDEFVMSTPRISSMKWWPGALGKSSTHAIVLAQLVIDGKRYGLQAFMVQLRSLDDHVPMPGVIVGDIGPKMALNNIDNGFLILNNVRIPRENMLMKNAMVTRDGNFRKLGADKSNYSTMMYVRVQITFWAMGALSYAITTGVRYSAVRRQSSLKASGEEMQVLDYQAQQYKTLPAVASTYALYFTQKKLKDIYNQSFDAMMGGDRGTLSEMHSLTSAMKALCSEIACEHLETLRRALGGHGFMTCSGIAHIQQAAVTLNTVEGENTVLYQQTARYLLKNVARALAGDSVSGSTVYLTSIGDHPIELSSNADCHNMNLLLEIYQRMAYRTIVRSAKSLQADLESGLEQSDAWNNNMVDLCRGAKAHGWQFMIQCCKEALEELRMTISPELYAVLRKLVILFALYGLETNSGNFLETESISPTQLQLIRKTEMELLSQIRPEAVALVDALDIHDFGLNSALGCYDGNVYERMYQSALNEPMNKTQVHPSYYKYLRGLIKGTTAKL